jgi:group I intron endonuclease
VLESLSETTTKRRFTIYCHTCVVNGKKYVGQTVTTMEARWKQHARSGKKSCRAFYNAIRKHGPSAFRHEIIDVVTTQSGADIAEARWIEHYGCRVPFGYNLNAGGGTSPKHEESNRRTSESVRAAWARATPEERADRARKMVEAQAAIDPAVRRESARIAAGKMTPGQLSALAQRGRETMASLTLEQRRERARKAVPTRLATIAAMTPEERHEKYGCGTLRRQSWHGLDGAEGQNMEGRSGQRSCLERASLQRATLEM